MSKEKQEKLKKRVQRKDNTKSKKILGHSKRLFTFESKVGLDENDSKFDDSHRNDILDSPQEMQLALMRRVDQDMRCRFKRNRLRGMTNNKIEIRRLRAKQLRRQMSAARQKKESGNSPPLELFNVCDDIKEERHKSKPEICYEVTKYPFKNDSFELHWPLPIFLYHAKNEFNIVSLTTESKDGGYGSLKNLNILTQKIQPSWNYHRSLPVFIEAKTMHISLKNETKEAEERMELLNMALASSLLQNQELREESVSKFKLFNLYKNKLIPATLPKAPITCSDQIQQLGPMIYP